VAASGIFLFADSVVQVTGAKSFLTVLLSGPKAWCTTSNNTGFGFRRVL
jgi:hypothetical protein